MVHTQFYSPNSTCGPLSKNQKMLSTLEMCIRIAKTLKKKFPLEIMALKSTTVIIMSKENRGLCKGGGGLAHYHNTTPHRICIQQKFLRTVTCCSTYHKYFGKSKCVVITDLTAMVEIMCHELAHHRTKGHAKGFKKKFLRFYTFMQNEIASGRFYEEKK